MQTGKCAAASWLAAVVIFGLVSCGSDDDAQTDGQTTVAPQTPATSSATPSATPVAVSSAGDPGARIIAADAEPGSWLTHGRTYSEQRHSPLADINVENVGDLGLAWYFDIETKRGVEATPLVVDGVMYLTGSWSIVYALDAETGKQLWRFDPKVPGEFGAKACCDVVNRGLAWWGDKVYVGTIDGRLIALDAQSGDVVWDVQTTDRDQAYTITGAPRVVKGKVVIGNGGAEFGVRGYVSAYDAGTGEMVWRFYTVPGDPALGFESPTMEMAAKTWNGEWWVAGGGGTAWDALVFDPELDLLFIGVGNGSPWEQKFRSPGGGDNLFLSSIVAVRPDSGEYVWHYQTTPGENWDYTATQPIMLADLEINGAARKVLMQAPKNGFFYVLDRQTGELLSAEAFAPITWATHVDLKTGRPVETPGVRERAEIVLTSPGPLGAHNWHPMAFHPSTGLVYIPVRLDAYPYKEPEDFEYDSRLGAYNIGGDLPAAQMPEDPEGRAAVLSTINGALVAWDPVSNREVWRVDDSVSWNGGVLASGDNLLFQGQAGGHFVAYRADNGEKIWDFAAQTGVLAGPISYVAGDDQMIAVAAGWGSGFALLTGAAAERVGVRNVSRVLAFKLGGSATLPANEDTYVIPEPPPLTASTETVAEGRRLYASYCFTCHGDSVISGRVLPDLRHLTAETHAQWQAIVLGGSRTDKGMISYSEILSSEASEAIHAYVIARANADWVPPSN
jgi:quinohemoprotein ethanol dehydrogenase